VQQDMGLYGNLLVTPQSSTAYAPVNGERAIILDDILLGEDGLPPPYGTTDADHALMGRYGNALLINGENAADLHAQKGSVLRLFLTNAANTRTFRIRIQKSDRSQAPAAMKLVGADGGHYERETFTDAVTLAPSERAIVDVLLPEAGYYDIVHEPSLASPRSPRLFLGHIEVADTPADPSYATAFGALRTNADVVSGIDPFRSSFDKQPDHVLHLSSRLKMMGGMGHGGMMMGGQPLDGIEWEDPLPMMNAMATKANTQWKLIDEAMKKENMDIDYSFNIGDKVKIRIVNDGEGDGSDHAMQHPIHFHGQRFLVLSEDGEKNEDLAWKDTVLVPKGRTIDILIDASNPGDWMFHCHIAEHLSNGMMGRFSVRE
jgi:FtsP/CotA-like multicopper oxidase with cupredoxin domain